MTDTYSHVVIIGLGASGLGAARLAAADGSQVLITDRRPAEDVLETVNILPPGTLTELGGHPLIVLDNADLIILSPGVPSDLPLVLEARRRGLSILSEIEFAWRHRPQAPLAAVTGSNGKSTVTTLLAQMMRTAGMRTVAGGNLGPPASEMVLDGQWQSWVLEISSFQSETLVEFRPRVGVFLNLSQDHLERHPNMAQYAEAKGRLFAHQQPGDAAILNADDQLVAATVTAARKKFFSITTEADADLVGDQLHVGGEHLIDSRELRLSGRHNIANALAAALAAQEMGVSLEAIRETLRVFSGLPHRHRIVHEADGIRWIDDSKATNVGATVAALGGYPSRSVHLILGGLSKGQNFSALTESVGRTAAMVYLIGKDAPALAQALEGAAPVDDCRTLERAVERARSQALPGQCVLLAPACASFDQFDNYSERGEAFERLATEEASSCR
ncbi:MAG: UDP-N-acetylmuramoyl-L-alanine--D-glutamate ligase [Acidobacteria bacterium]|nr:UDP-N-acetylmuramoyl-L-alanine--D-glutamate ligase [Acidobacteriota bacterium]